MGNMYYSDYCVGLVEYELLRQKKLVPPTQMTWLDVYIHQENQIIRMIKGSHSTSTRPTRLQEHKPSDVIRWIKKKCSLLSIHLENLFVITNNCPGIRMD